MTKKDYIALSKLFKGLKTLRTSDSIVLCLAARMARMLKEDNPRFEEDRFIGACRQQYEMGWTDTAATDEHDPIDAAEGGDGKVYNP